MAPYQQLPVFRNAMEAALFFETGVRRFNRFHKYAMGAERRAFCREIVRLVIRANRDG